MIRLRPGLIACGLLLGASALIPLPAFSAAPAAAPMPVQSTVLASHKALYAVSLTSTRAGADYLDVSGKMVLEFTDTCDAWTTNQKSMLRTVSGEGTEEISNSDFAAWENKAGDDYKFSVRQSQNGDVTEFRGRARRNGPNGSGVAEYTKPEHKSYPLPPHFLFQTAQQVKLIELAQKGVRFFSGDMFDGSEGGGAARFNAIVLKSASKDASPVKNPLLDSPPHRIRVAFYPAAGTGDQDSPASIDTNEEPEYEMTMTVHDNGVVSDYDYDYEDFSVHGSLVAIQAVPRPHC